MEFYYKYITTYHNNTRIGTNVSQILTEKEPKTEIINLTWDNLNKYYSKNGLSYKFTIYNLKRGRKVCFFNDFFVKGDEKDVKEWKNDLNIYIKITYKKYKPSIADVLKWYDAEKAIIYLKERGLEINIK